ncbi:collectin-10 [Sphaeramia orbicularis]|uniref:collectin-10 n=1 Tax=Sphaeramia orbicularis TaxID=375764 RepID=UPI00117D27DD|nr:collectin-10-like [Sphaeramia orbicularis]
MARRQSMGLLGICICAFVCIRLSASIEVCTNSFVPGAKGDQGVVGDEGDEGRVGKNGPPGLPGAPGEPGLNGDIGHTGKMGPPGDKGDKGDAGMGGPSGLKGKPGTTCDCGRYRKVVGQLDINVGKLRNAVKFLKNIILGLRETEERYYLLVKEPKMFREASMNCKLRGGTLAMPKTTDTNRVMSDYISQAGLTRVYIGVKAQSMDTDGTSGYIYADSSPLQGFAAWSQEEALNSPSTNSSCVELLSSGTWGQVDCEATMFFICEFPKSGGGARGSSSMVS